MSKYMPNVMRNSILYDGTAAVAGADFQVFNVSDNDLTVPSKAFELKSLVVTNEDTAVDAVVRFYDNDLTSGATIAATDVPVLSVHVDAKQTVKFAENELLGARFFFEIVGYTDLTTNNIFIGVSGIHI